MILTKAPLRLSFFCGATDIADFYSQEEGAALGTTIDKYYYVVLQKRFENDIVIGYMKKEFISKVEEIKHDLVRESFLATGLGLGLEVTTLADVPARGSGLGSSSSLLVALLKSLNIYKGKSVSNLELAEAACKIEIEILGRPIGKQDQYWAAFGGFNLLIFKKDGQVIVEKINLSRTDFNDLESNLTLFHTGIDRNSADILNTFSEKNFKYRCCLRDLAYKGRALLEKRDFDAFGSLLNDAWKIKKALSSKISNSKIDFLYEEALRLGALGGKLMGAGGGGFFLFYCPSEKQRQLREKLPAKELPFHFDPFGARNIFNNE